MKKKKNMIGNIVALIDKYELDHQLIEIELTESEDYQNFEPKPVDSLNMEAHGL